MAQAFTPEDPLPYRVEIRDGEPSSERVIGRAASIVLARAIFTAAQTDFAGSRIVLFRGAEILAESSESRT